MGEVVAADGRGRQHGKALGQRNAGAFLRPQQVEEQPLLGVIRAGGVARSRPDSLVALLDETLVVERFVWSVAPELPTNPLMQQLGECLREPVCQGLGENRIVIVMSGLEAGYQLL